MPKLTEKMGNVCPRLLREWWKAAGTMVGLASVAVPASAHQERSLPERSPVGNEAASDPASAREREPEAGQPPEAAEEIVVTAPRRSGRAKVGPLFEINPTEIESYASDTVGDLITALQAQTGSPEPVVLVNGQRVTSGGEVGSYPPESIERIEVLPPEAAAIYGYPPGQQLLNLTPTPRPNS